LLGFTPWELEAKLNLAALSPERDVEALKRDIRLLSAADRLEIAEVLMPLVFADMHTLTGTRLAKSDGKT
jgi:hypothetical protein